jgi:hypothetical protein
VPAAAAVGGSPVGLLGYGAAVAGRAVVARRVGGRVLPDALWHPGSVLALSWLTVDSWGRRATVQWKGRPVAAPVRGSVVGP